MAASLARASTCMITRMLCAVLLGLFSPIPTTRAESAPEDDRTVRLQWANDLFVGSDNQFTNGISVQIHSAARNSLSETGGTPAFGRGLAKFFLPERNDLVYREGWSLGQNMQTPEDIERDDLILDDIPYVGMMGWENSFIAFNDHELTGAAFLVGWVGPSTHADDLQEAIHDLTGNPEPRGWEHQLEDEPLLNVYFAKKRKFWKRPKFDASWALDAAVGNFFTYGQAGLEIRIGRFPRGFAYVSAPVGRSMNYDARLPVSAGRHIYASLALRATGFAWALPREGNTFRDDNPWTELNRVQMEDFVGQAIIGLHIERPRWAVHFHYWFTTDTLKPGTVLPQQDTRNSYGALTFEWKIH